MATESKTELAVIAQNEMQITPATTAFANREVFDHSQRVSLMLSKSDLIPDTFKGKPENIMIALEIANRVGASPLMVMQNLYIVYGKPAWSSQFLIATLNASGRFSALRYEQDDKNGGRCRAYATDKNGELCHGAWVSMEMATAEGWVNKNNSKWKSMPELMMRYRAAAFFTRQFAPEISMGIHTYEEVIEVTPPVKTTEPPTQTETESDRFLKVIQSCDTLDKLNKNRKSLSKYPEHQQAFMDKETELTPLAQ